MANFQYAVTPLLGVNIKQKDTDAQFKVGTVVTVNGNKLAMYIKASGVIGNSNFVTVDQSTTSFLGSSVDSAGTGTVQFRCTSVAFAANEFGWVIAVENAAGTNLGV